MKHLPILLIILTATLASCKKEPQGALSGKWQETKLVLYQDSANVVLYDTTYLQPFTNYDYIQFNSNSTCTIGNDHYYYGKFRRHLHRFPPRPIIQPMELFTL